MIGLDSSRNMSAINNAEPREAAYDVEKNETPVNNVNEFPGDHKDDTDDSGSELKQDGVKQVEAVTQTWSKTMLWTTFFL